MHNKGNYFPSNWMGESERNVCDLTGYLVAHCSVKDSQWRLRKRGHDSVLNTRPTPLPEHGLFVFFPPSLGITFGRLWIRNNMKPCWHAYVHTQLYMDDSDREPHIAFLKDRCCQTIQGILFLLFSSPELVAWASPNVYFIKRSAQWISRLEDVLP